MARGALAVIHPWSVVASGRIGAVGVWRRDSEILEGGMELARVGLRWYRRVAVVLVWVLVWNRKGRSFCGSRKFFEESVKI
jgi:hypothetical protein